jgi:hypothetical protein
MAQIKKLTAEMVAEIRIRRAAGENINVLAAHFGVHKATISRVARGEIYNSVATPTVPRSTGGKNPQWIVGDAK